MELSVICVYNDKDILSNFLGQSLDRQSYDSFEKIFIDNRDGHFSSMASALNIGADEAEGRYLFFVHQDVMLPTDYLSKAVRYLRQIDRLGVAGAAGVRETGKCCAETVSNIQHGEPPYYVEGAREIAQPTEVSTLDELLLIVPNEVFQDEPFSTSICRGWHLYGVEYSMRMKRIGRRVQVLPISLWHRSDGGWRDWRHDLTLLRLIRSYPEVRCIHTTGGSWPATRLYVIYSLLKNVIPLGRVLRLCRLVRQGDIRSILRKVRDKVSYFCGS